MSQILVIKPRWFEPNAVAGQIRSLEDESPGARVTLLAEPGFTYDGALAMPNLRREPMWEILRFALRLRKTRFLAVVVLADELRPDNGYLESKLWAFVARAQDRRLGSTKRLSIPKEIGDKWHEVVVKRLVDSVVRGGAERLVDTLVAVKRGPSRRRLTALRRRIYQGASPITTCMACGSDVSNGRAPEIGPDFVTCAVCGCVFPARIPDHETALRLSGEIAAAAGNSHSSTHKRLEACIYLEQNDRQAGGRRGNFLDAGSAGREYQEAARDLGWIAYGLALERPGGPIPPPPVRGGKPDSVPAEKGPQIPLPLIRGGSGRGSELATPETPETFQFIVLIDVLGHLRDPQSLFAKLEQILAPDGRCLIRIPDTAKLRPGSRCLSDLLNVWFPSAEAVRRLAEQHQMEVCSLQNSTWEEDAIDIWLRCLPDQTL